jgi:hypothetical protein
MGPGPSWSPPTFAIASEVSRLGSSSRARRSRHASACSGGILTGKEALVFLESAHDAAPRIREMSSLLCPRVDDETIPW